MQTKLIYYNYFSKTKKQLWLQTAILLVSLPNPYNYESFGSIMSYIK